MTTTTSVELRIENREVVCDWGIFGDPPCIRWNDNSIIVQNVAPLILVSKTFADDESCSARKHLWAACVNFYTESDRRFMRIDVDNGTWIWELFDAHWEDGEPSNVYIGRWRD